MQRLFLKFCRINPAFLLAVGLLNGILPWLIFPELSGWICFLYVVFSSFPLLLISRREFAKFAISSLSGFLLTWYTLTPAEDDFTRLLPQKNCGAVAEVRITDPTAAGEEVSWLPLPGLVKAEVLRMRYSTADKWRQVSGETLIKFPRETTGIAFGDVLQLEGYFALPEAPAVPGGFDFKMYLKSKGITRFFVVNPRTGISFQKQVDPLWISCGKGVLRVRDYLLTGMSDGMDLKNKKILAAILFGCRQGLNYDSRRQFMKSGVMHIFAISGLHVGMVALTLYILFCWVPFRKRHLLIPCFLFLYVLTTGMQASAMRAFLMIGIWSLHRSALKSISPINTIFLAAVLVLLWNPFSLLGAGFQYSFIIAGFLVLSWHSVKRWFACLNESNLWHPEFGTGWKFHLQRLRNTSLNSLFCSFTAWMAGSGLNLFHRNFFVPGALFANFIILPLVWLLFFLAALNIVFFPLRHLLHISSLLQCLLQIINSLSFAGAVWGGSLYLSQPPYWMLALYFCGLLLLVTTTRKKVFILAAVLLVGNVIFWHYQTVLFAAEGELAMLHGDASQVPAFIIIPPGRAGITVINVGSKQRAHEIVNYLTSKGINEVDTICFSQSGKDVCDGAWVLFSSLEIRQVIFPYTYRRSEYAKFAKTAAVRHGTYVDLMSVAPERGAAEFFQQPGFWVSQQGKSGFDFKLRSSKQRVSVQVRDLEPGCRKIILKQNNDSTGWVLENSNKLKFYFP